LRLGLSEVVRAGPGRSFGLVGGRWNALDAGIDIKVVSEQLGHSTTTLTGYTYQSVTKQMHQDVADAVARIINRSVYVLMPKGRGRHWPTRYDASP
jgi:hypothetical protein